MCYNSLMERLLDYFKPEHYRLELYVFTKKRLIRGTVVVTGEVKSDFVKFHAVNQEIKSVSFSPSSWMTYEPEASFESCRYEYDDQELKIPITSEMRMALAKQAQENYEEDLDDRKMVTFRIEFESKINSNMEGCYLSSYEFEGEEREIVATQFESHYAREVFPCVDDPAAKAIFYLTLLTPDIAPGDVVLANTPLETNFENRYTFTRTPEMSTYLLAWVIGPLQSVSTVNKNGVRVSSYCALNQPLDSLIFANETAARTLEYYDELFGEPYPLRKLDQVALPDFEAGAMENWGLVTYRESMMLSSREHSTLDTKKTIATTVTHELSHQWFGDLVTMKWWDDLWLNESFATIMEYFATDALYPDFEIWEDFFTGDCLAALKRDCLPGVQSVKQAVHHPAEIATLFDSSIVYAKGARLVLMLIRLMGEKEFFRGVRYYFDRFKFCNTIGDDLWMSLQPYADFDVKEFMEAWISQPGYPYLESSGNPFEPWSEKRFLINATSDETKWPLLAVKDDMSGHYLVALTATEFAKKLSTFDELSLEQKLRFMIDRMMLARAGLVEPDSLIGLIPKLSGESSAAVWEILSSIIADLKIFCPLDSAGARAYKSFLRKVLQPKLAEVDLEAALDSGALRRRDILLGIAYYAEDEPTLRALADLYSTDFGALDSELRSHILSAKLYFAEDATFPEILSAYKSSSDPALKQDLLATLGVCARQPKNLKILKNLLEAPDVVRPQDNIFLYIYLLRNPYSRPDTLRWLTKNWDYILKITGDKSVEDYARYAADVIRSDEEAKIFFNFFDQKLDDPILSRTLKVARDQIDARLALIKRYSAPVAAELKQRVKSSS